MCNNNKENSSDGSGSRWLCEEDRTIIVSVQSSFVMFATIKHMQNMGALKSDQN
jgi:hypothetical protein